MRIEFDPTNRDEATAVRAVLAALHGAEPVPHVIFASGDPDPIKLGEGERRFAVMEPSDKEKWDTDAPVAGVPDLDANNEPHDPRIHSTPAKTNADGTWRAKRGVTAEQVAAVRAEREAIADENSGPIEIKPEDFKAHVEEMTNGAATVDSSGEVVKVSAAPTPPSAPPEPTGQSEAPLAPESATTVTVEASTLGSEAPTSHSFLDVMKAITAAQKDGKIDTAKVKELCAAVGAGESTMGLNGPDNGDKRGRFMALLATETEGK